MNKQNSTEEYAQQQTILPLVRTRRLATSFLLATAGLWICLLVLVNIFPEHSKLLHLLILGAEAGVVGGLADWYAITVLFHDPFKHIWVPRFIREHTAIIPRNKMRIADSMGRFVQENFLAPQVVRQEMEKIDTMLIVGKWIANPDNASVVTHEIQRLVPRFLRIFQNKAIDNFLQQNTVEWLKGVPINQPVARTLQAMFDNDIHHDVIQLVLDTSDTWISNNPEQTKDIIQSVLDETGIIGVLSVGASAFGIDITGKAVAAILKTIGQLRRQPNHPIRQMFETSIANWTLALELDDSPESARLNAFKIEMCESPTVVNFFMHVLQNLREGVIADLESKDSAIGKNLRGLMVRFGEQLLLDEPARKAFNEELTQFAEYAANRYSGAVIDYIRKQIVAWDTRQMIEKIESEVGGDLHMIRINGVVVGFMVGIVLGLVRLMIEV